MDHGSQLVDTYLTCRNGSLIDSLQLLMWDWSFERRVIGGVLVNTQNKIVFSHFVNELIKEKVVLGHGDG